MSRPPTSNSHELRRVVEEIPGVQHYSLHLYGSFAAQPSLARDVDAIAITPDLPQPILRQATWGSEGRLLTCNLYCVPESAFRDDCAGLMYGGFYAHKFAFSFQEVGRVGISGDSPAEYWLREFQERSAQTKALPTARSLIMGVHVKLVRYRPTVVKSLTRFLRSPRARVALQGFVEQVLVDQVPGVPDQLPKDDTVWQGAFTRFWAEYAKHKGGEAVARQKMASSFADADLPLVEAYLRSSGALQAPHYGHSGPDQ